MSQMLESLANPAQKDQLEERIARVKEDPSLKPILDEIETGGPAVMMRSLKFFLLVTIIHYIYLMDYLLCFSHSNGA